MSTRHGTHFGATELPEDMQRVLRRARRLEIVSIVYMVTVIAAIYLVMGSSQAMRAAWVEDLLSLVPPIAFLVAVALVISLSIVKDGWSNLKAVVAGLTDTTARTFHDRHGHPLVGQIDDFPESRPWIAQHRSRVRDMGHVFRVEVRVVPRDGEVDLARLHRVIENLRALDWKLDDVTVSPALRIDEGETTSAPAD